MIEEIEILRQLDDKDLHGRVITELEVLQDQNNMRTSFGRRDFYLMDVNSRKAIHVETNGSFSFDVVVSKLSELGFYQDRTMNREKREQIFYCPRVNNGPAPTMGGGVFDSSGSVFPAGMFGGK